MGSGEIPPFRVLDMSEKQMMETSANNKQVVGTTHFPFDWNLSPTEQEPHSPKVKWAKGPWKKTQYNPLKS